MTPLGAIPSSSLPGHGRLHQRAVTGLDRCQEAEDFEFKESAEWAALKHKVILSALAMGNLRDGGLIIVGVAQRNSQWELTGIAPAHLATYDPDQIASQINAYVSPHVDTDVVVVEHRDKRYVGIYVREFRATPLVCKKNGPTGSGIIEGRIYVRLPAPVRTSQVTSAEQMHDLLELAAEKRARHLLEASRRIGLSESHSSQELFDRELGGL